MQKHQHPNKHNSTQETSGQHRSSSEPLERLHFCFQSPFFTLSFIPIYNKQTTPDKILSQQSIKNYTAEYRFLMMIQSH